MIWHVYIIESKEGLHYTGMTTNLEKRSIWTKRGTDWKLIYKEVFQIQMKPAVEKNILKTMLEKNG